MRALVKWYLDRAGASEREIDDIVICTENAFVENIEFESTPADTVPHCAHNNM